MFIHNVYFWLTEDLDEKAIAAFELGLQSLCQNPPAQSGYFGKPADTHRDVIERTYTYGMVLFFKDKMDQDAYQVGDIHHQFLDQHKEKWNRVTVYDITA